LLSVGNRVAPSIVNTNKSCNKNCTIDQAFDSLLPIIDEYVAEKQKSEGLFFKNFEAQMSSNSGMTQISLETEFKSIPITTLGLILLSLCLKCAKCGPGDTNCENYH